MKNKTIFALLQMYINKEPMPKRIKYGLMREGYEYFRWEDDDCFEYVNEGDGSCFLSDTPWHHYMDEVEIVDEPQTDCPWGRTMTIDKIGGRMPIHLEDIEDTDIDLLTDEPRTVPLYPMKEGEETNEDNSR